MVWASPTWGTSYLQRSLVVDGKGVLNLVFDIAGVRKNLHELAHEKTSSEVNMLDLIRFILTLFTNPLLAIGGIVIIGLIIGGLRWSAYRASSNIPLDAAPEVILRQLLKFGDEDLEKNRSGVISPKQLKRIRKEFLILLIAYIAAVVFSGFLIVTLFWENIVDMFKWGFGIVAIGLVGFMTLVLLFMIGMGAYQLWGYTQDLRRKRVVALLSPLVFEEHEGEYMTFKFKTHQYNIIVSDPRLSGPLPLRIGFVSEDVWRKVQQLSRQTAILYVATNTSKLLSFELVATERYISQKDVS